MPTDRNADGTPETLTLPAKAIASLKSHHIQIGNFVWFEKDERKCPGYIFEVAERISYPDNLKDFKIILLDEMDTLICFSGAKSYMRAYPREKAIPYVRQQASYAKIHSWEKMVHYVTEADSYGLLDIEDYKAHLHERNKR